MGIMRNQAIRFGADLRTAKVSRLDLSARPFGAWVGDPNTAEPTVLADSVIIATGARSLMLGCPTRIGSSATACQRARPVTASSSTTTTSLSPVAAIRPSKRHSF